MKHSWEEGYCTSAFDRFYSEEDDLIEEEKAGGKVARLPSMVASLIRLPRICSILGETIQLWGSLMNILIFTLRH